MCVRNAAWTVMKHTEYFVLIVGYKPSMKAIHLLQALSESSPEEFQSSRLLYATAGKKNI